MPSPVCQMLAQQLQMAQNQLTSDTFSYNNAQAQVAISLAQFAASGTDPNMPIPLNSTNILIRLAQLYTVNPQSPQTIYLETIYGGFLTMIALANSLLIPILNDNTNIAAIKQQMANNNC